MWLFSISSCCIYIRNPPPHTWWGMRLCPPGTWDFAWSSADFKQVGSEILLLYTYCCRTGHVTDPGVCGKWVKCRPISIFLHCIFIKMAGILRPADPGVRWGPRFCLYTYCCWTGHVTDPGVCGKRVKCRPISIFLHCIFIEMAGILRAADPGVRGKRVKCRPISIFLHCIFIEMAGILRAADPGVRWGPRFCLIFTWSEQLGSGWGPWIRTRYKYNGEISRNLRYCHLRPDPGVRWGPRFHLIFTWSEQLGSAGVPLGSEILPHFQLIWTAGVRDFTSFWPVLNSWGLAGVRESELDINTTEKYQETWDMATSGQTPGSAGVHESELDINTTEKYLAAYWQIER